MRTTVSIYDFRPVKRAGNHKTVLMWDEVPVMDKGKKTVFLSCEKKSYDRYLSPSDIREEITAYYNRKTEERILDGYEWKGMKIWLSRENQMNYKSAHDLAYQTRGKNLPLTFKFGTMEEPVYYTFKTVSELQDFYMGAFQFIHNTLAEGWKTKDAVEWKKYE